MMMPQAGILSSLALIVHSFISSALVYLFPVKHALFIGVTTLWKGDMSLLLVHNSNNHRANNSCTNNHMP